MPLSQPGIFNALDYGLKAESSGGTGPANQGFLQDAIAACQAAGGGTVLIPSQDLDGNTVYPIIGPIDVGLPLSGEAEAIIIAGSPLSRSGKRSTRRIRSFGALVRLAGRGSAPRRGRRYRYRRQR